MFLFLRSSILLALGIVLVPCLLSFGVETATAVVPAGEADENDPLRKEVLAQKGIDVGNWGEDIANPFANLAPEGKAQLKAKGIDVDRLVKLRAVFLTGNYCGACSKTFVNKEADTILVIGAGFITHGTVYSVGPVLAVEDAHFMGDVIGAGLVWFADESLPRGRTQGRPLILGPQVRANQANLLAKEVWHGDFGWRFLRPAASTLTAAQLEALWTELGRAGERGQLRQRERGQQRQRLRTLVAGAAQTVPFFKERLCVAVASADDKKLARLIADLGGEQFRQRQAATEDLEKLGTAALPALNKLLRETPTLEMRQRAEQLVQRINTWQTQRQAALAVLETINTAEARRLLEELAVDRFGSAFARQARMTLERLVAGPAESAGAAPPSWTCLDKEKQEGLRKLVMAQRGTAVQDHCPRVGNPFADLTDAGKAKLKARGVAAERLAKLPAYYLTGNYCGARGKTFVNKDADAVLVVGKGFITHAAVYSLGPVLAVDDAHFMSSVIGADLVWFVDTSFPRGQTSGWPVILAPEASHSQMHADTPHVWYGDYGWRRPEGFPKMLDKEGK